MGEGKSSMKYAILGALAGVTLVACFSHRGVAVAQEAMLYTTKHPPGSSYVRVVNGGKAPAKVAIGSTAALTLASPRTVTTPYYLFPGGKTLTVTIDGKAIPVSIPPNKYLTLIYRPLSNGTRLSTIIDSPGDDNGLLAELRFYNLIPGCGGTLGLQSGGAVFERVSVDQSKSRSINPTAATLVAKCGSVASNTLKLPQLKAGDQYSIFLVLDGSKPVAVGNADTRTQ
jgi:alginate O-acetyltransferase complex protein AlgF